MYAQRLDLKDDTEVGKGTCAVNIFQLRMVKHAWNCHFQHYPYHQVAAHLEPWIEGEGCLEVILVLLPMHIRWWGHLNSHHTLYVVSVLNVMYILFCNQVFSSIPSVVFSLMLSIIFSMVTPCCSCAAIFIWLSCGSLMCPPRLTSFGCNSISIICVICVLAFIFEMSCAFVRSMVRSITGLDILASKLDTVWVSLKARSTGKLLHNVKCNNCNHVELQNRFDRFSPAKSFLVSTIPHFLFAVSWFPVPGFIITPRKVQTECR